jgi:hypothetical protein
MTHAVHGFLPALNYVIGGAIRRHPLPAGCPNPPDSSLPDLSASGGFNPPPSGLDIQARFGNDAVMKSRISIFRTSRRERLAANRPQ